MVIVIILQALQFYSQLFFYFFC